MTLSSSPKKEPDEFKLASADVEFSERSKDIFSTLSVLESKHNAEENARSKRKRDDRSDLWKPDPVLPEAETGQPSHRFKRPRAYPPRQSRGGNFHSVGRRNYIPDYKKHPENWTEYSLEDVEESEMSDRSNTAAAFAFLDERRKMREAEEDLEKTNEEETSGRHVFKRPTKSGQVSAVKKLTKVTTNTVSDGLLLESEERQSNESETKTVVERSSLAFLSADENMDRDEPDSSESPSSSKSSFKKPIKSRRTIRTRTAEDEED